MTAVDVTASVSSTATVTVDPATLSLSASDVTAIASGNATVTVDTALLSLVAVAIVVHVGATIIPPPERLGWVLSEVRRATVEAELRRTWVPGENRRAQV